MQRWTVHLLLDLPAPEQAAAVARIRDVLGQHAPARVRPGVATLEVEAEGPAIARRAVRAAARALELEGDVASQRAGRFGPRVTDARGGDRSGRLRR